MFRRDRTENGAGAVEGAAEPDPWGPPGTAEVQPLSAPVAPVAPVAPLTPVEPVAPVARPTTAAAPEAAAEPVPPSPRAPEAPMDTRGAEEEIGRLVLRVREITNSMLDDARRQAEELVAKARADAAGILAAAEHKTEHLRADSGLAGAADKLQNALAVLGEVNAALVRQLRGSDGDPRSG